ncbi:5412_t:CDS:2 [Funneliformis geosporum]|uniref:9602_t:CDS:1 n=1 Tax=Funneliformis geosporum TaxID=1117311 RepID=A0A9W4SEM2_9GLOM|nr:9602_t:CDS:2 [Funneliformis geosporum]CAI2180601.1 5412_t:CDS:2 [Funneliformis geosporum]
MILSQEERKDDVLEEPSKKKSPAKEKSTRREVWTTEELKKLLTKFKVTIEKPSPGDFEKELPSRSKKAIAHKLDYIDKRIKEFVENGDIF